jgi:hypothetical protein
VVHHSGRRTRLIAIAASVCCRVTLGRPAVSGAAHPAGGDRLMDGAFRARSDGVLVLPGLAGLFRACACQGFVEFLGPQRQLAASPAGGGALLAYRARSAGPGSYLTTIASVRC